MTIWNLLTRWFVEPHNAIDMKTFIVTFWRENPQLKNGGRYTTRTIEARTEASAREKADKIAEAVPYDEMYVVSVD